MVADSSSISDSAIQDRPGDRTDLSRRCPLTTADPRSTARLIAMATDCTQRSRNLSPLQASGCQPLGAWHCARGFQDCSPELVGDRACIEHFNHYLAGQGLAADRTADSSKTAVADSSFVARFSTCLGREPLLTDKPATSDGYLVAEAETPSFVGNHGHGWDAMFAAIIGAIPPGPRPTADAERLNLVLGFEHLPENYRIMATMLGGFGIPLRLLSDGSDWLGSPDQPPPGRPTSLAQLRAAPAALDTLLVRPWQLPKTARQLREHWGHPVRSLPIPMGLAWSDAWLNHLAQLSGYEVPALLQLQRYQLCEAIHHARPLIGRQRFAVYGEPDFVMGISRYLIELGGGPAVILSHNANHHWLVRMQQLLSEWGYPHQVAIHIGSASPSLEQLTRDHRPDLLIAPPALRDEDRQPRQLPNSLRRVELERPTDRLMPPATLGYPGARHLLNAIVDAVVSHQ